MRTIYLFLAIMFTVGANAQTEAVEATLLGEWSKPGLEGSSTYDNIYNDLWGLAFDGREYAVMGSTAGTHFLEVTDPANIQERAFVAGASAGPHIIHRDYHHMDCYLYAVADEGLGSTLQIIDFSGLPDEVNVIYDSNETLLQAHNIFIDSLRQTLYCMGAYGGEAASSALRIYDISNPVDPVYLAEYSTFGGLSVGHVHDAYIHDGLAYLNCGNDGFAMVDFTDPMNPQTLGILTDYQFAGYNHSGWPSNDGQYYYLGDETHGFPMKVLDVSDPEDITVVEVLDVLVEDITQTIPHNQIVACNYLYATYYYDGIVVYDIADPANPVPAYFYDTSDWPFDHNYRGAWGVYPFLPSGNILVSDMQEGLVVLSGPGDDCHQKTENVLNCELINATHELAQEAEVKIFPQPASKGGFIQLQLRGLEQPQLAEFRLLDGNGRLVKIFPAREVGKTTITLQLDELPAGMYLLEISTSVGQLREKVLVF